MTASLDLFNLFVENTFGGSILFTIIALSILFAIFSMVTRMSFLLLSNIVIMFLLVMLIGFFGSFFAIIIFSFSAIYFFSAVIPWIRGWVG